MVRPSGTLAAALAVMLSTAADAYWLMGSSFITTERIDPIVSPGRPSGHVHSVVGGSNFAFESSTDRLRGSQCTSLPIKEDKSNYWFPHLYFQWANGSFSSVNGGAVIYYLFPDKAGTTKAFPPNFRMISGNPTKRSYDASNFAQQAVDFLCLDFNGKTTKHTGQPEKVCPSGIRSQVNFPSCWNGKDVDSPDHKSHVAFRSEGPDKGECKDPNFPVSIPRIFLEVYWATGDFDKVRSQAMKPSQPFVFAYGDRTGFGNHADFFNGWDDGVLERVVDGCNCNPYGDPQCCADKGLFTLTKDPQCKITKQVDEVVTGMLPRLPGNNPVQEGPGDARMLNADVVPAMLSPAYVYTGSTPNQIGKVVVPAHTIGNGAPPPSSAAPVPSSSAVVVPTSSLAPPASSAPAPSSSPGNVPTPAPTEINNPGNGSSPAPSSAPALSSAPVVAPPSASSSAPVVVPPTVSSSAPASVTPSASSSGPVVAPPAPTPTSSQHVPAPPASDAPSAPAITLLPSPIHPGKPTGVKTWISTRLIKPTGACKKKTSKKAHLHRRATSPMRRRHDF